MFAVEDETSIEEDVRVSDIYTSVATLASMLNSVSPLPETALETFRVPRSVVSSVVVKFSKSSVSVLKSST